MNDGTTDAAGSTSDDLFDDFEIGRWTMSLDTLICTFDSALLTLAGLGGESVKMPIQTYFDLCHPDDQPGLAALLRRVQRDHGRFDTTFRLIRPVDGRTVWINSRGKVVVAPDGRPMIDGINHDVTRFKDSEFRSWIVAGEMAHRVKNLLAVVQALFRMSARGAPDIEHLKEGFLSRLETLKAVNDLVLRAERGLTTDGLMRTLLGALANDPRLTLRVEDIALREEAVQTMSLSVNELLTNAMKHGALQDDNGQLTISISRDVEQDQLALTWRETCARPVAPPGSARGFGTTVLQDMNKATLEGTPYFDWKSDGLHYSCTWPFNKVSPVD